jgi:hypothetical protein
VTEPALRVRETRGAFTWRNLATGGLVEMVYTTPSSIDSGTSCEMPWKATLLTTEPLAGFEHVDAEVVTSRRPVAGGADQPVTPAAFHQPELSAAAFHREQAFTRDAAADHALTHGDPIAQGARGAVTPAEGAVGGECPEMAIHPGRGCRATRRRRRVDSRPGRQTAAPPTT